MGDFRLWSLLLFTSLFKAAAFAIITEISSSLSTESHTPKTGFKSFEIVSADSQFQKRQSSKQPSRFDTMGFLKLKKKKVSPKKHDDVKAKASSDNPKAPVSEINVRKNDSKKRSNKRAPATLNSRSSQPLFTDYVGSDNGKRLHYKSHLFELSQKLVDETPPERRQSLVTAITGVTDESHRLPSLVNDYHCHLPMTPRTPTTIRVMTQDDMERKEPDTPDESGVLDFVLNFQSFSDTICGPLQKQDNGIEFSQPVLESGPATIPREISFAPLIRRDESLISGAGQSKHSMLDSTDKSKYSLLKRITGKTKAKDTDTSVMARLKVFVDAPAQCGACPSHAASVDGSMLTTPSMKAGSLVEY
jgi:hypothetical protein